MECIRRFVRRDICFRIFLLWQAAYAELYFSEILWPDFRELELLQAVAEFQSRERRFGLTGKQLKNASDLGDEAVPNEQKNYVEKLITAITGGSSGTKSE